MFSFMKVDRLGFEHERTLSSACRWIERRPNRVGLMEFSDSGWVSFARWGAETARVDGPRLACVKQVLILRAVGLD